MPVLVKFDCPFFIQLIRTSFFSFLAAAASAFLLLRIRPSSAASPAVRIIHQTHDFGLHDGEVQLHIDAAVRTQKASLL